MKKTTTSFVCQECGYDSPQWLGKCPECGNWNSLREIRVAEFKPQNSLVAQKVNIEPKRLDQIKFQKKQRLLTGFSELDTVLGGGIVKGSAILLAGDPGIGKSTLLLQIGLKMATAKEKVLYISAEESEEQIKLRADRISSKKNSNLFIVSSTNTDLVCEAIQKLNPALVIVDSIQTMESENVSGLSGSVGQVRYGAFQFIKLAKTLGIPVVMVGHVTKEGMVAGPMVLSHMVDTLLFLEGEKFTSTRILRSLKNRFGPVDEIGLFAMEDAGIKELTSPEQLFLSKESVGAVSGSVLSVTMEGTRPFLIEIQALVVNSKIPIPRRVASGIDYKRLELLLAVLQKHCNIPLSGMDVFVNVAGGIKLSDPGTDLSICLAIISSFQNIKISNKVGIGEVGLLGEVRRANSLEKRIKEAQKLGFKDILSSNKFKTLRDVLASLSK
ncbi:MAG: DNA repair protein RadA [Candidatus Levybacteria bacterium RIFCSPLOWO2_01_FULL_39_24]|nr:MAG: DNA repair protein RadA [Candidatus Levybacteria bacterium RIFCSPHIGHO2_01_FULL_40_16]OGH27907.1 MAG: DNA repair protein RadA [Candidatus Levybacteria bacterium RIFCSPHIGHO2_12_FULL_39_9]OGH46859.1 MAG: DNA repair protein RadA [Candidatus Levybacteria bacterium RIFCSPLOWO2_01_FULL_39_24]